MRLRYTRRAQADLSTINDYLKERNPSGAQNVIRAIHRAVALIARQPLSARATDDPAVRVKLVAKYPYKVFYRVSDCVDVIHVRHAARRPWEGEND